MDITIAKLIGAGDGSVMLYCAPCRACLSPSVRTLEVAGRLWAEHAAEVHPPERVDLWAAST
jgi:hypothetical protein